MTQSLQREQLLSLNLPQELRLQVTPAQFVGLAQANRDLTLERTATGVLIVSPPTGGESGKRNFQILGQLSQWVQKHESLGEGFDSSTGFTLPNGANRSPDAAWVRRERWEALTPGQREGFIPLCPDFVAELRSKTDSFPDLREKMAEYRDNGSQLGWLIDPQNRRVEIYRPGQAVEILDNPAALSGEEVLPSFTLSLTRIFSV